MPDSPSGPCKRHVVLPGGERASTARQIVRHKLTPDEIAACARRALKAKYKDRLEAVPVELDEMTLDELRLVVTNGDNWKQLDDLESVVRRP